MMNNTDEEISEFLKDHPNSSRLLKFLDVCEVFKFSGVLNTVEMHPDFLKVSCNSNEDQRCPFSLWIERSTEEVIFFNIGKKGHEAVVFHYLDVSSENILSEVLLTIKRFLESKIKERQLYCKGKLKKITYKFLNNHKEYTPVYTCLVESYFFCSEKTWISKKYDAWI